MFHEDTGAGLAASSQAKLIKCSLKARENQYVDDVPQIARPHFVNERSGCVGASDPAPLCGSWSP